MKNLLVLLTALWCGSVGWAQPSAPAIAKNIWRPINERTIVAEVNRNLNDGMALDTLWLRVGLAGKEFAYLDTLRAALRKHPNNATLMAAYARGLRPFRFGYNFLGKRYPAEIVQMFEADDLRNLIQGAKEKDPRCWLAYVAEAEWGPTSGYGNLRTARAEAAKVARRAYALQKNPLTMVTLGRALTGQSWYEGKPELGKQAVRLLRLAQKTYPWYPTANAARFQVYAYYPGFENAQKAREARQFLIGTVPVELRNTQAIRNYLESIRFDRKTQ